LRDRTIQAKENIEQSSQVPDELGDRVREVGSTPPICPEAVGGGGLDNIELALLERELGRVSLALASCVLCPAPILRACAGEQIERDLKPTIVGDRVDCFALTEPGAGSDATKISTQAVADDDDFVLNARSMSSAMPMSREHDFQFVIIYEDHHVRL
jgi:acyl-CoA dehydrogenase